MDKQIKVIHRGYAAFEIAMKLAACREFEIEKPLTFNGYKLGNNTLLLSAYSKDIIPFPCPLNAASVIALAWVWLEQAKPELPKPNTDGSTAIGFEVTTDGTGVGSDDWGYIVAIRPVWLVYGK